ncbi:MAG: HNH endonuclease [Burkholderiaceae bacterium]|nr:MAG: HNH endonuclease [Burkholderiaceae bacterium]
MSEPVKQPLRLSIELVPRSCWYSNVRSNVRASTWDRLQAHCFERAKFRCEICGGVGPAHPVECHEIWSYLDAMQVQRLDGLIALCPMCHEVKHIGRAIQTNRLPQCMLHLARVNQLTAEQALGQVKAALATHSERSARQWRLDLSFLTERHKVLLGSDNREPGLLYR